MAEAGSEVSEFSQDKEALPLSSRVIRTIDNAWRKGDNDYRITQILSETDPSGFHDLLMNTLPQQKINISRGILTDPITNKLPDNQKQYRGLRTGLALSLDVMAETLTEKELRKHAIAYLENLEAQESRDDITAYTQVLKEADSDHIAAYAKMLGKEKFDKLASAAKITAETKLYDHIATHKQHFDDNLILEIKKTADSNMEPPAEPQDLVEKAMHQRRTRTPLEKLYELVETISRNRPDLDAQAVLQGVTAGYHAIQDLPPIQE